MTEYFDVTTRWIKQAKKHFDGRGFTGTIGPQQTKDLSTFDFKINVVDGLGLGASPKVLENLRQTLDRDDHISLILNF
jgi:hypothetical protein